MHFDEASQADIARVSRSLSGLGETPGPTVAPTDVNVLVTGWGSDQNDISILHDFPNLALIAHMGGSVKSIVTRELMERGVKITQAATVNARPVAEFTLATILMHCKQVRAWEALYREQRSSLKTRTARLSTQVGIRNKTIGLVGASRIGRRVIELLAPHGAQILLHDPHVDASQAAALGVHCCSIEELMERSDVISLHQPLLPETIGSINADLLSRMPDGCLLINTARGKLIDHDALVDTLANRPLHAVLDVTDPEPLPDDSPLWDLPNVQLTPHIAGSMGDEVSEMTALVIEEIERFGRGEALQHEVTLDDWDRLA